MNIVRDEITNTAGSPTHFIQHSKVRTFILEHAASSGRIHVSPSLYVHIYVCSICPEFHAKLTL